MPTIRLRHLTTAVRRMFSEWTVRRRGSRRILAGVRATPGAAMRSEGLESRVLLAGTPLVVDGYAGNSTVQEWGLTESFLSTTRDYLLDSQNFGDSGVVDVEFVIGAGVDTAGSADPGGDLAAVLQNTDIFFSGLATNLTQPERDELLSFVTNGGALIATTDSPAVSIAGLFGVFHGSSPPGPAVTSQITNFLHPVSAGPFGLVTSFEQFGAVSSYSNLGTLATEIGANNRGTSLAVIEPGAVAPGSGPVILVTDTDVFTDPGVFGATNPGGGAVVNSTLIRNVFAYAAGVATAGGPQTEVSLDADGNLVITDTNGGDSDDSLIIRSDVTNGEYLVTDFNNLLFSGIPGATAGPATTIRIPFSAVTGSRIIVNTLGGDDSLTVDRSLGEFTKTIIYNGGEQATAAGDSLVLTDAGGAVATTVTHTFSGADSAGAGTGFDGSVDIDGAVITYTGLEPIDDQVSAQHRIFNYGSTPDDVTLDDIGIADDGRVRLSSAGTSESVDFVVPTMSLTINGGDNDDEIRVVGIDDQFDGELNIDGQEGSDIVDVDLFEPPGGQLITGSSPAVLFVMDVSGSTTGGSGSLFQGDPVGDLNGDGQANTILDAEIAAFIALNQDLIARGVGDVANVGVVTYSGGGNTPTGGTVLNDMDLSVSGVQVATSPLANSNGGFPDVEEVLRSARANGQTNYEAAFRKAIEFFNALGTAPGEGTVVFLSDGDPTQALSGGNPEIAFLDEVAQLRNNLGINLRAFGVGNGASLEHLVNIDPGASIFTTTNELLAAVGGLDLRSINVSDSGTVPTDVDTVSVNGTDTADTLRATPGLIEMTIPNRWLVHHDGFESVQINTGDGDDSLLLETDAIPEDGLTYNAGGSADNDTLDVTGGTFLAAVHTLVSATDGSIRYSTDSTTSMIAFTGLEPVVDSTTVNSRVFEFSDADDTILLSDDGVTSNGFSFIDSDDSDFAQQTTFRNPLARLAVNSGDGIDSISVRGLDSTFAADLVIGEASAVEDVRFDVLPTETQGGDVMVTAGSLSVATEINSGGGDISLVADSVTGSGDLTSVGGSVSVLAQSGDVELSSIDSSGAFTGGAVSVTVGAAQQMFLSSIDTNGITGGLITLNGGGQVTSAIVGNGSLIKAGFGTLELRGDNTYSGTTTITEGTLSLIDLSGSNIALSSAIHVAAAATLDATGLGAETLVLVPGQVLTGDGTIAGGLLARGGSVVSAGSSPGVLTILGDLEFASGSFATIEIGGPVAGTGAGFHDQLNVIGTVTISQSAVLTVVAFDDGTGSSYVPTVGAQFLLIDNDGSLDAVNPGIDDEGFNHLAEGDVFSTNFLGSGRPATISYRGGDGNDVVLLTNSPPVASAGGPYSVPEGGMTVLDASGSSDLEDSTASLDFLWDLDGDGIFGETGADAANGDEVGMTPTFDAANLDGPDTVTVTLIVTDSSGETDVASATVTVDNVAPQNVSAGDDQTVSAGDIVSLSGSFNDPGIADTHAQTWTVVSSGGQVVATGDGSTISFQPTQHGTYTATYTVEDDDGGVASDEVVVTVENQAPVIETLESDASSLLEKSDDGTVTIIGSYSDSGLPDTHTVLVDWGDGSAVEEVTVDQQTRTFEGTHEYANGGIYSVTVTVVDDGDLSSAPESVSSVVTGVGVVDGTLYIIGTNDDDNVKLRVNERKDELKIDAKFGRTRDHHGCRDRGSHGRRHGRSNDGSDRIRMTLVASEIERVVAFLCDGDDTYDGGSNDDGDRGGCGGSQPVADINIRQIVFGGDGDDRLSGGRWNDALFGGAGDDDVNGEKGHDILVGGDGRDRLNGGRGDDLLIGGRVDNDFQDVSVIDDIDAAMTEWAGGNLADAMQFLGTVVDDDERDHLFGGHGDDSLIGGSRDRLRQ
ncbi:MAG: PKD domain-containing protein [Planctomycetaceae bacterium]